MPSPPKLALLVLALAVVGAAALPADDYEIGPGDVLRIAVLGQANNTQATTLKLLG